MMICNQCKEVKHSKCENIQKTGQPLGSWCACQHREYDAKNVKVTLDGELLSGVLILNEKLEYPL